MLSVYALIFTLLSPPAAANQVPASQNPVNQIQLLLPREFDLDQHLTEELQRLSAADDDDVSPNALKRDEVPWDSILGRTINFGVSIHGGPSPYSRNAGDEYAPASTSKLFTAALAIEKLGLDFKFETQLRWRQLSPDTAADLTLVGSGDPTWGVTDLVTSRAATDALASQLAARGIQKIQGAIKLIASDPRWDSYRDPRGWDGGNTCSYSPALAFTIYRNCSNGRRLLNSRPVARQLLMASLQSQGIRVVAGPAPAGGTTESATYFSLPLSQILVPFLKHSINVVGEALLRKVGEKSVIAPGRDLLEAGQEELADFVAKLGARTAERSGVPVEPRYFSSRVTLYDGSGLSDDSRVTGDAIIALLRDISIAPYFEQIWSALPIAGVDGTLKTRMKGTAAENLLRAKTGTIKGVYNLAGYVPRMKSGRIQELVPFVILTKDAKSSRAAHLIEDRLGRALAEAVIKTTPAAR